MSHIFKANLDNTFSTNVKEIIVTKILIGGNCAIIETKAYFENLFHEAFFNCSELNALFINALPINSDNNTFCQNELCIFCFKNNMTYFN